MNTLHVKYLLVGGGLASSAAAETIRRHDAQGSVLLVTQENNRPYHRPALSGEYMRRERARADLTTFPPGWMKEHDVELRTGRRVSHIDTSRACATLDNGQVVSFDHLLIATGAHAKPLKIPGAELPSVYSLRTLDDADRLHHAIDTALREGHRHPRGVGRGRVAVIGAGLLGCELAASFTHLGLHVDLIVGHAHPWARTVGETTGAFLTRHLQNHGVEVHCGHRAERFEGDGRVQHVALADGLTIDCDLAVTAVGIVINREILRDTPIAAETAILVDQHCRTSVPNIYAAGDCAAIYDPLFGKHRIIDHWENALTTGAIAGANMAGVEEKYEHVNHFVSHLFNLSVNVWGERRFVHHRLIRGNAVDATDAGSFVEFGVASDGRIAQVIRVGADGEDANTLKQCVAMRLQVNGIEEQIKDPANPLAELL